MSDLSHQRGAIATFRIARANVSMEDIVRQLDDE